VRERLSVLFRGKIGIVLTLGIIVAFFALNSPFFLRPRNLINILNNSTITLILATGMTFVLATGGVDLSVGSTIGLTGVVVGLALTSGMWWPLAILVGIAVGATVGLVNGWTISRFGIQPFIMSLAMLSIVRGLALVISGGQPVFGFPRAFTGLFAGKAWGIPSNVILAGILFLLFSYIATQTRFGLYTRSIGGSAESAEICGVAVNRIRILVYVATGVLASIASMVFMSFMDAAEPLAGLQTEWLEAIAAPIIGGASLAGGVLSMPGTLLGALILATLRNGLNIMRVQPFFQQLLIGLVIVVSVVIDALRNRREATR
jgi:ribose transport system permease protein